MRQPNADLAALSRWALLSRMKRIAKQEVTHATLPQVWCTGREQGAETLEAVSGAVQVAPTV